MTDYRITKEQINYLVDVIYGKVVGGKGIEASLRSWFPEAFEEWEEVPLSEFSVMQDQYGSYLAVETKSFVTSGMTHDFPIVLSVNKDSRQKINYKIESGRIWRKKSAE